MFTVLPRKNFDVRMIMAEKATWIPKLDLHLQRSSAWAADFVLFFVKSWGEIGTLKHLSVAGKPS